CGGQQGSSITPSACILADHQGQNAMFQTTLDRLGASQLGPDVLRRRASQCRRPFFTREREALKDEVTKVAKQIDRLVTAMMAGADALSVNAKLKTLECQKTDLESRLATAPDAAPLLHPALATMYRNKVEKLESCLRQPDSGREAFELIRG